MPLEEAEFLPVVLENLFFFSEINEIVTSVHLQTFLRASKSICNGKLEQAIGLWVKPGVKPGVKQGVYPLWISEMFVLMETVKPCFHISSH